jgi:molybdopterin molybdotransferase
VTINDCFAQPKKLLSVADALMQLQAAAVAVTEIEIVPLAQAGGRILAAALVSDRDIPGFNNAALDGYALRGEDLIVGQPTILPIVGQSTAGHASAKALQPGTAMRILTGAQMPIGADTVVMQEDVERIDGRVTIPAGVKPGSNWRPRGEDVSEGQTVLSLGQCLRAQDIGMAAAVGSAHLSVFKALRVAVFSTGDEVVEPGQPLAEDGVYDINRYMLRSWLQTMGCEVTDLGILPDQYEAVSAALTEAATSHDVIMTSGGASTGDTDHIADVLKAEGSLNFWRLAMKPGKPLALGQIGTARFIGLPGNPVAVGVCFLRFAYPLLAGLSGQEWVMPRSYSLPSAFSMKKKAGRCEFVRAQLLNAAGIMQVARHPKQGSGVLSSLVEADGFVELAEDLTQVETGDLVTFYPINQFGFI